MRNNPGMKIEGLPSEHVAKAVVDALREEGLCRHSPGAKKYFNVKKGSWTVWYRAVGDVVASDSIKYTSHEFVYAPTVVSDSVVWSAEVRVVQDVPPGSYY